MKPVIVLWTDAYSEDEWMNLDAYSPKAETPNVSIGYIVHDQNNYLHVASTIDQDGSNFCGIMAIPHEMIIYVAPLTLGIAQKLYGDAGHFEEYLNGKFAQRPEITCFLNLEETVSETLPEPSPWNPIKAD